MNDFLANTLETAKEYAPMLLAAVAILALGWIVASILSRVVRAAFRRISLDDRLSQRMSGGESDRSIQATEVISRGVYFLVMMLTLLAVFQSLQLTIITEPINGMMGEIMSYLPRIAGAGLLMLIAWIVASVVRAGLGAVLRATSLDSRLGESLPAETTDGTAPAKAPMSASQSLAEAVYWLVFLLFLPAVVGALGMQGLLGPAEDLTGQIVGFLPNLLAAALIFGVGWFVARIVQKVVTSLLFSAGVDRFAQRAGANLGSQGLSGVIGTVLYALILVPVLIASLNALKIDALTEPASAMLNTMLEALPMLLAALLVLAASFLIGRVVGGLVTNVLGGIGFDNVLLRLGLDPDRMARRPSQIAGTLVFTVILYFAVMEAFNLMGLTAVAVLASELLVFAGRVALGVLLLGAGMYVANLVAQVVSDSGAQNPPLLARVARVAVLVLTGAMALRQMGMASDIINMAFGLLLGAAAVAAAVAFGIGGRGIAERQLARWMGGSDNLRSRQAE